MRAGALVVLAAAIAACTFTPPGAGSDRGEDATSVDVDAADPGPVDGSAPVPDALIDAAPPPIDAAPPADTDGDGVIDRLDNCTVANPAQHDADADGLGDACDVTCSPVGLGTSNAFGPEDGFVLSMAQTNGATRPNVARGETLALSVRYTLRRTEACPNCVSQIYWGLEGERAPIGCPFSDTVSGGGESGTDTATITAPNSSGVYYLRGDWSWDFDCADDHFRDDPASIDDDATRYGAFCVIDPR